MPLSITQVIEQVGREEIGYVHDAPFHYVVFTRSDNTWNLDRINVYLAILDKIEASTGPGVMVTIGTGKKHFSSGFDLPYWMADFKNMKSSIVRFCEVMARLLEFSMPTMCIFNGNAIAGGYILGLCHDYRIMNESVGAICLSELKLGLALPYPYMVVCRAKLDQSILTRLACAITVKQPEALKDQLIDSTYANVDDLQTQITAYAKRYANLGAQRMAVKMNKIN